MSRARRSVVIATIAVAGIAGVAGGAYAWTRPDPRPQASESTRDGGRDVPAITAGEEAPIAVATPSAPPGLPVEPGPDTPVATDAPAPLTGGAVSVVLAFADWDADGDRVEAAGLVSGVVEAGGICTLTLERGEQTVAVTTTGEPDATTTNCGSLTVPGDRVREGEWAATLTYTSETSQGVSAPATVTVGR